MYIETPRMCIRDFKPEDADALHEILGDAVTMEYCEEAYTPDRTKAFLASFCIARHGAVAAVHRRSGKLIGYILFNRYTDGIYEMGWMFNRNYWRRGYAYESCKAVIDHAFSSMHAHKIFAETIDSGKSVKLMKKLGMRLEGVQRSQTTDTHGAWCDLYLYGLLDTDRSSHER